MDELDPITRQEAAEYRPGCWIEFAANPGQIDRIAEYDPFMVPPIWLCQDPKPRYPHELKLLERSPLLHSPYPACPIARSPVAKLESSISAYR